METSLLLLLVLFTMSNACEVQEDISMRVEDIVEVYTGESAEIHCHYDFTIEPHVWIAEWNVFELGDQRVRITYSRNIPMMQAVVGSTSYSGRISVQSHSRGQTLTIHGVQRSDERKYFCRVTGYSRGYGWIGTSLKVYDVPEPPVIRVLPGVLVSRESLSKIASCETRDGFIKPTVTWYRDHSAIHTANHVANVETVVTRKASGLFTVKSDLHYNVTLEDKNSHFSCEISSGNPGAVRTFRSQGVNIIVNYGPEDVQISGPDVAYSGELVSLTCSAASEPSASLNWYLNGVDMGLTEETFLVHQSDVSHGGEYSCTATNHITGISRSVSHMLVVRELCVDLQLPEQQSKAEGETAFLGFSCSFSRHPIWFVWYSESSMILLSQPHTDPLVPGDADAYYKDFVRVQSQHSVYDVRTSYEDRVSVSSHNLTLVMKNLTLQDSGNYSLIVLFDDWSQFRGQTSLLVSAAAERRSDTQLRSVIGGAQRPGGEEEIEQVMEEPEAD